MRIVFPAIYKGKYIYHMYQLIGNRLSAVPIIFFLIYWVMPLLLLLIPLDCPLTNIKQYQNCIVPRAELYVRDYVHFAFAISATAMSFFAYSFLLCLHVFISNLAKMRSSLSKRDSVLSSYGKLTNIPFRFTSIIFSFALAIMTFIMFWNRVNDSTFYFWWGNSKYGIAGYYFSIIVSGFVFIAIQYFILIACIGAYLLHFARNFLLIYPCHSDGAAGLSSAGRILLGIWQQTALVAICILIVFSSNYLGIVENWVVWGLAAIAVLAIPFTAIVPFIFLVSKASRQKKAYTKKVLNLAFPLNTKTMTSIDKVKIIEFHELSNVLNKINIMPIKGWRIIGIGFFNLIQLYISFDTIVKGLSG